MTKIKLCGLSRDCDINWANQLMPDYIGFVFAPKSKRYVTFERAEALKNKLNDGIIPVGVFVNEDIENIKFLISHNVISVVQLHGNENSEYIEKLRREICCPIIQAFRIETKQDVTEAEKSTADFIMLDSGGGTGKPFNHALISGIKREFFLAGGLDSSNVNEAIAKCRPYGVDTSSALETEGVKDKNKMTAFVKAVRDGGK